MQYDREQIRKMVSSMYKNEDGSPVYLSDSQCDIFATISMRLFPRNHCETFTRFGKSRTTGLAVLTRAATYPEKWVIVAGTKEKAKIIMGYINAHIFDNEYTASRFRMEKGDSAEAIRRNRNKNHISFDVGNGLISEIFIVAAGEALGYGSPNVVEDEAALIDDTDHSMVMRMLGDNPENNFLFKIGNPFQRNHFLKSRLDPEYNKIIVDCYRGIDEGRINQQTIEENRPYSFFKVLYECKFPDAAEMDDKGWMYLLSEEDIQNAMARWDKIEKAGMKRLGNDVARGGRNQNVWCERGDNYATILQRDFDNDLMSVAGKNISFINERRIGRVMIDDVGVGGGVTDRMKEQGYTVFPVKEGSSSTELVDRVDPRTRKKVQVSDFANMRAQLYAGRNGVAQWIKRGGALDPKCDWSELLRIRYKKNSSGQTIIESKESMRERGEESPDTADSLMLTFFEPIMEIREKPFVPVDPKTILDQGKRLGWGQKRSGLI